MVSHPTPSPDHQIPILNISRKELTSSGVVKVVSGTQKAFCTQLVNTNTDGTKGMEVVGLGTPVYGTELLIVDPTSLLPLPPLRVHTPFTLAHRIGW
jgi:hypothetical protein